MSQPRGQAATELALGGIVMVTILLFGIHFAEMGFLGTKVHEAAASTMWDATAYRTHSLSNWYDTNVFAVPAAQAQSGRYADFDGRASHVAAAPTLATTKASPIGVQCFKSQAYAPPAVSSLGDPGGITCTAQADVNVVNIGTNFANDSKGFFGEQQKMRTSPTTLCSSGRLGAGGCGTVSMLLGDDGLHDGTDQNECGVTGAGGAVCGSNPNFYNVAHNSFNLSAQSQGMVSGYTGYTESWVNNIVPSGVPGGQITGFYMSFRGEGSNFTENISNGGSWQTSPMDQPIPTLPYRAAFNGRQACQMANGYCYLGVFPCN
jgi:hypothetical protein